MSILNSLSLSHTHSSSSTELQLDLLLGMESDPAIPIPVAQCYLATAANTAWSRLLTHDTLASLLRLLESVVN